MFDRDCSVEKAAACRSAGASLALATLLAVGSLPVSSSLKAVAEPTQVTSPEIRLTEDRTSLPIVMVGEFPFVEASVAGIKGKLMLDTGAEEALILNSNRVPITDSRPLGTGRFGSGQTFEKRLARQVRGVRVGPLHFPQATDVRVQDARLLEQITPDFLGWLGYRAWANHAMKLDYRRMRVTFYRGGPGAYLKGERVMAELPLTTRSKPNIPLMSGHIADLPIIASWDSGQYGALFTNEASKLHLIRAKHLTPSKDNPGTFDLSGLVLNGRNLPPIPRVEVETRPSPAASAIGITEPHMLTIGYGLLRQYKTVWDYRRRSIYLLTP